MMKVESSKWKDTHKRVLGHAVRIAAREGLSGLSIDDVAKKVEMSRSGLYAHFSSKYQLQLATVEAAWAVFTHEALPPARASPKGVPRLLAFCDAYLSREEPRVFSRGVLLGVAVDSSILRQSGLVKLIVSIEDEWLKDLEGLIREASSMGDLDGSVDPAQLAFELNALVSAANSKFALQADSVSFGYARRAIRGRLLNQ